MVAICTPSRDTVQSGFCFDLVNLVKHSPDTFFTVSQGTLLPNQRTDLVKRSLGTHSSHVLFIDGDMRFPEDVLEKLLAHDLDIVGANCKHRQADSWTGGISSEGKTGLERVGYLGFGVTLIKSEVFNKIQEPWFATPYDGVKFVGEDVFFFDKAKKSSLEIYIDHDLSQEVKHIGSKEY